MTRTVIIILTLALLVATAAQAMPPRPGSNLQDPTLNIPWVEKPNPDAYKVIETKDGDRIAVSTLVVGTKRYPVIMMDYSDKPGTYDSISFNRLLFSHNISDNSMSNYYLQNSDGKFWADGSCFGWYHSGNSLAYYGNNANGLNQYTYPQNAAGFIVRALQLASSNINFSQYSTTGGKLDLVIVIHSGEGAEGAAQSEPNWIWSHNSNLAGWGVAANARTYNGIEIDKYTIQPEISSISHTGQIEIGVYAHELGHALGLPDFYDTRPRSGSDTASCEGIGRYCLMSSGSWGIDYYNSTPEKPAHLNPWAKKFEGWLTPVVISSDTNNLKLPKIEYDSLVLQLNTIQRPNVEYFLVENRQKAGFDTLSDGKGLLIWHIDENTISAGMVNNNVNTNPAHKGVDLEQAKGPQTLDTLAWTWSTGAWALHNRGDFKDYYPYQSNNYFNDFSLPNSKAYSGSPSGVGVLNIHAGSGDTMVLNIGTPAFTIGLLYNPAFRSCLGITAVSKHPLYQSAIDTSLMSGPAGTAPLPLARIDTSRAYQSSYSIQSAGSYTLHLAARDAADTTIHYVTDRQFEAVLAKTAGGACFTSDGRIGLLLAAGAVDADQYLLVDRRQDIPQPGQEIVLPATLFGAEGMALGGGSQLAVAYNQQWLAGRPPDRMALWRFENGSWVMLPARLDESGQRLLAPVDRLGVFAMTWDAGNPSLDRLSTGITGAAHPNPFCQSTMINYQLSMPGTVSLRIYNILGQMVRQIDGGHRMAGVHTLSWDGMDGNGRQATSGVYHYRLLAGGQPATGKLIKIR